MVVFALSTSCDSSIVNQSSLAPHFKQSVSNLGYRKKMSKSLRMKVNMPKIAPGLIAFVLFELLMFGAMLECGHDKASY